MSRRAVVAQFYRSRSTGGFSIERVFSDINGGIPSCISIRKFHSPYVSRGIINRIRAIIWARRNSGPVNHITGHVHYLTFLLPRARTVLTIHDCEMIKREKGLKRLLLWFFWLWLPMRRSQYIVTISEASREEIYQLMPRCHREISVIPNPVSDLFQPQPRKAATSMPTVLQIGTKRNKNIERVIRAVAGAQARLLVIGELSPEQIELARSLSVEIECRSGLSDEEIVEAYASSDVVILASLSEGFGLPIIEAQAVGRPVVCSKLEPMASISGGAAILVDPYCVDSIRAGIMRALEDPQFIMNLIKLGYQNSAKYTVKASAQSYAKIFLQAVK